MRSSPVREIDHAPSTDSAFSTLSSRLAGASGVSLIAFTISLDIVTCIPSSQSLLRILCPGNHTCNGNLPGTSGLQKDSLGPTRTRIAGYYNCVRIRSIDHSGSYPDQRGYAGDQSIRPFTVSTTFFSEPDEASGDTIWSGHDEIGRVEVRREITFGILLMYRTDVRLERSGRANEVLLSNLLHIRHRTSNHRETQSQPTYSHCHFPRLLLQSVNPPWAPSTRSQMPNDPPPRSSPCSATSSPATP